MTWIKPQIQARQGSFLTHPDTIPVLWICSMIIHTFFFKWLQDSGSSSRGALAVVIEEARECSSTILCVRWIEHVLLTSCAFLEFYFTVYVCMSIWVCKSEHLDDALIMVPSTSTCKIMLSQVSKWTWRHATGTYVGHKTWTCECEGGLKTQYKEVSTNDDLPAHTPEHAYAW